MNAFRSTAVTAKAELSPQEYIAATWARNGLAYDLLDEPLFRQQFGVCVPSGIPTDVSTVVCLCPIRVSSKGTE